MRSLIWALSASLRYNLPRGNEQFVISLFRRQCNLNLANYSNLNGVGNGSHSTRNALTMMGITPQTFANVWQLKTLYWKSVYLRILKLLNDKLIKSSATAQPQLVSRASLVEKRKACIRRTRHGHRNPHRRLDPQRLALAELLGVRVTDQRVDLPVRHTGHLLAQYRVRGIINSTAPVRTFQRVVHVRMDARLPAEAVQRSRSAGHHLRDPSSARAWPALAEVARICVAPQRVDVLVRSAGRPNAVVYGLCKNSAGCQNDQRNAQKLHFALNNTCQVDSNPFPMTICYVLNG